MRALNLIGVACLAAGMAVGQDVTPERVQALENALRAERERNDAQARRIEELELTLVSVLAAQSEEVRAKEVEAEVERVIGSAIESRLRDIAPAGKKTRGLFNVSGQMRFVTRFFGGPAISTDQSFELEHLIVQMTAQLDEQFSLKFSPGVSHQGGVFVLEAYGTYAFAPWAELSAGRFLVPFTGTHAWAFPSDSFIEPYLAENSPKPFLYSPYWDEGLILRGRVPFGSEGEHQLYYAAYALNGFDAQGLDGIHKRNIGDNNTNKTLGGRVSATFRLGDETHVAVGVAGLTGKYDAFDRLAFYALEADVEVASGPASLYMEVFYRPAEIAGTVLENPAVNFVDVAYLSGAKVRPAFKIADDLTLFAQLDYLQVRQPPRAGGQFSVLELENEGYVIMTGVIGLRFDVTPNLRLILEGGLFDRDDDLGDDIRFLALSAAYYF